MQTRSRLPVVAIWSDSVQSAALPLRHFAATTSIAEGVINVNERERAA